MSLSGNPNLGLKIKPRESRRPANTQGQSRLAPWGVFVPGNRQGVTVRARGRGGCAATAWAVGSRRVYEVGTGSVTVGIFWHFSSCCVGLTVFAMAATVRSCVVSLTYHPLTYILCFPQGMASAAGYVARSRRHSYEIPFQDQGRDDEFKDNQGVRFACGV